MIIGYWYQNSNLIELSELWLQERSIAKNCPHLEFELVTLVFPVKCSNYFI